MNKFIRNARPLFKSLPKPIKWQSFLKNDLPLVTDITPEVQRVAGQHKLNKSQTKALNDLARKAPEAFRDVSKTGKANTLLPEWDPERSEDLDLRDISARDIRRLAVHNEAQDRLNNIRNREPRPPANESYDVIVIDPPWPMQKISRDVRPNQASSVDYPTLTVDEIKQLNVPCAEDCHVWVWTTQKFLPVCLAEILPAWDLRYVCGFVWHKPGGIQPTGLPQYNAEFAVYCRRGAPRFVDTKDFKIAFDATRGAHSEKPEEFYDMVRRVTAGRRLDMFNRRQIEGFEGWGLEAAE